MSRSGWHVLGTAGVDPAHEQLAGRRKSANLWLTVDIPLFLDFTVSTIKYSGATTKKNRTLRTDLITSALNDENVNEVEHANKCIMQYYNTD